MRAPEAYMTPEQMDERWKHLMANYIVAEQVKEYKHPEPECQCFNHGEPWTDPVTGETYTALGAGCRIHGIKSNVLRRCAKDDRF